MPQHSASARTRRIAAAPALLALLALGCADSVAPSAASPSASVAAVAARGKPAATMRFGRAGMTGFEHMSPKAMEHTQAGHAVDKVFPHTVVIDRGQTVAFESFPVHQLAVYAPGTMPADIRLDDDHLDDASTPFGVFPNVLINDPLNRLDLSPISWETMTWTPAAGTFDRPGRYLVICTLVFHYVPMKMYGWVEVR